MSNANGDKRQRLISMFKAMFQANQADQADHDIGICRISSAPCGELRMADTSL